MKIFQVHCSLRVLLNSNKLFPYNHTSHILPTAYLHIQWRLRLTTSKPTMLLLFIINIVIFQTMLNIINCAQALVIIVQKKSHVHRGTGSLMSSCKHADVDQKKKNSWELHTLANARAVRTKSHQRITKRTSEQVIVTITVVGGNASGTSASVRKWASFRERKNVVRWVDGGETKASTSWTDDGSPPRSGGSSFDESGD